MSKDDFVSVYTYSHLRCFTVLRLGMIFTVQLLRSNLKKEHYFICQESHRNFRPKIVNKKKAT